MAEEVEMVERPCPEADCDYVAKGPKVGGGNAALKLGNHRRIAHGYKSDNPDAVRRRNKKGATGAARDNEPIALSIVKDAAGEISSKKTGAPSIDELDRALARMVGTGSVLAASYAAETDPTVQTEADRDAIVDYLSLAPEAAREVAYPFARILGKSSLNKRYGRALVDNVDAVSATAELVQLAVRWRRYMRTRELRVAQLAPSTAATGVPPAPAAAAGPIPRTAPPPSTAPQMSGVVVTPDMVSRNGRQGVNAPGL